MEKRDSFDIIRKSLAKRRLLDFTQHTKPNYKANWHHKLICDKLDKFIEGKIKRLMILMPPRHGKQVSFDTPVFTPSGWTIHGDLQVGDEVFGPDGNPTKVIALSEESYQDIEVELSNGQIIECHENHEWSFYDRSRRVWRTKETNWFLNRKVVSSGRCIFQLPNINPLYFAEKNLEVDPYFLGVWLGDGTSIKPTLNLCSDDEGYILSGIPYNFSSRAVHKDTKVPSINYYGEVKDNIEKLGLFGNKHIPKDYLYSSLEQRVQLLAGLIDSDGHVEKEGRVRFVNTNKDLIDGVYELLRTLGQRPYLTSQEAHSSTTLPINSDKKCYAVGFQPTIDIPTRVPRKKIKRIVTQRRVGIKDVRRVDKKTKGNCIQVDREDGLYLVGESLIPTHNSELVSRRLPAYIFGKNPDAQVISATYGAELSQRLNRDVQRIIDSDPYRDLFPETQLSSKNVKTTSKMSYLRNSDIFEIVGRKGVYQCAGVGGALTGMGANYVLIDDPFKNQEEADSPTIREKVWDFYSSVLYTRLETQLSDGSVVNSDGGILLTTTRWHEDDLAGRLITQMHEDPENADQWEIINLPAIIETQEEEENSIDPRVMGEALWPDKFDEKKLHVIKSTLGSRKWAALYEGRPAPDKGDIVEREWWQYYTDLPEELDFKLISVDCAFKGTKKSDFVAIQVWGKKGVHKYLIHQVRAKMGFNATVEAIRQVKYKYPDAMEVLIEEKANGAAVIESLKSEIEGVTAFNPKDSKESRAKANAVAPQIEAGNVHIPDPSVASWVGDYVEEWAVFPNSQNDDQVDATSQALIKMHQTAYEWVDVVDHLEQGKGIEGLPPEVAEQLWPNHAG